MPVYSYKCSVCGRTEDKFRRVEDRAKEFDCDSITQVDAQFTNALNNKKECLGKMIFQPMQRTNFYFNTKGKQYKS